ncbi:MAG: hypothetical protein ACOC2L_01705, partial [Candidatus Sumerlaeota bacterium]
MALQPSQMSIREILEMVFANKWLFLGCLVAGIVVAYFLAERKIKNYQAQAMVGVENPMAGDPLTADMGEAVDKVVLASSGVDYQFNEVRERVLELENLMALVRDDQVSLPQFGNDYEQAARSIRASIRIDKRNNRILVTCTRSEQKEGLAENVNVPRQTAEIANAVAHSIVSKHREVRDTQIEQALQYLRQLRDSYAEHLAQAENDLQTYDELRNLADSEDPRKVLAGISQVGLHDVNSEALVTRYRDALVQRMENAIKLEGLAGKQKELERRMGEEPERIVKVTQQRSETHSELSRDYAESMRKLASLRRTRTEEHWEVQDQKMELEELERQLEMAKAPVVQQESYEVNPVLEELRIRRNEISATIAELRIQQEQILSEQNSLVLAIEESRKSGTQREQLKQKVALQTELYNDLMQRYAEAEVASDLASSNERAMRFVFQSAAGIPRQP